MARRLGELGSTTTGGVGPAKLIALEAPSTGRRTSPAHKRSTRRGWPASSPRAGERRLGLVGATELVVEERGGGPTPSSIKTATAPRKPSTDELVWLYWQVGHPLRQAILGDGRAAYGEQIAGSRI